MNFLASYTSFGQKPRFDLPLTTWSATFHMAWRELTNLVHYTGGYSKYRHGLPLRLRDSMFALTNIRTVMNYERWIISFAYFS